MEGNLYDLPLARMNIPTAPSPADMARDNLRMLHDIAGYRGVRPVGLSSTACQEVRSRMEGKTRAAIHAIIRSG